MILLNSTMRDYVTKLKLGLLGIKACAAMKGGIHRQKVFSGQSAFCKLEIFMNKKMQTELIYAELLCAALKFGYSAKLMVTSEQPFEMQLWARTSRAQDKTIMCLWGNGAISQIPQVLVGTYQLTVSPVVVLTALRDLGSALRVYLNEYPLNANAPAVEETQELMDEIATIEGWWLCE